MIIDKFQVVIQWEVEEANLNIQALSQVALITNLFVMIRPVSNSSSNSNSNSN